MKFESLAPIFCVQNVPASIEHYVNVLGFEKAWDWGEPATFGCVCRDEIAIFLCENGQGQPGTWLSIFVDDVDALYAEYQRSGANIRQPPTDFQWGIREMNIEDIDGHRLRIGHGIDTPSDNVNICGYSSWHAWPPRLR